MAIPEMWSCRIATFSLLHKASTILINLLFHTIDNSETLNIFILHDMEEFWFQSGFICDTPVASPILGPVLNLLKPQIPFHSPTLHHATEMSDLVCNDQGG